MGTIDKDISTYIFYNTHDDIRWAFSPLDDFDLLRDWIYREGMEYMIGKEAGSVMLF
jgi:hypothetical protein